LQLTRQEYKGKIYVNNIGKKFGSEKIHFGIRIHKTDPHAPKQPHSLSLPEEAVEDCISSGMDRL
jgi:hypothetical protein